MIVVDSSAVLEILLQTSAASRVAERLFRPAETLHAPHLLDVEVAQVLRRYVLRKDISSGRGIEALEILGAMAVERYSHQLLLGRIWKLRADMTAYDAAFVALAELLNAPLVTRDARLAASSGHRAAIELI